MKKVMPRGKEREKHILTTEGVCELTGYSKAYIYKLTCLGQIPYYKPNGKKIFFIESEIVDWLTRNCEVTLDEAIENMDEE